MTKFDFKQWVINNKYGKLNEQDARQRPRKGREMDMDMKVDINVDFNTNRVRSEIEQR